MKNGVKVLLAAAVVGGVGVAIAAEQNTNTFRHSNGMHNQEMMGPGQGQGQGMMGRFLSGSDTTSDTPSDEPNAKGSNLFDEQCGQCHSLQSNASGIGPNLHKLFGRTAGTLAGYNYSAALKNSGVVWDETTLDAFIKAPQNYIPGNTMPYAGLADDQARASLITFMKENSGS